MTSILVPQASTETRATRVMGRDSLRVILSFDIEEHHRIEAAANLSLNDTQKEHYRLRLPPSTRWILNRLEEARIRATFFILGEIALSHPALVKEISRAGHEIGSHGWDHKRVLAMTPAEFREDVRKSKDVLEQVTGQSVFGYRAPTFSITHKTSWALDILADLGILYDSSIYPVRHDRYGVPGAPRGPFWAKGSSRGILEIPPVTLRIIGLNTPMGGGGYFRLFPLWFTRWALRQTQNQCSPPVAMLYFHPWEFDPGQACLPLKWLSRWRTYVGIGRSQDRFTALVQHYQFERALDVARHLLSDSSPLQTRNFEYQAEAIQPGH